MNLGLRILSRKIFSAARRFISLCCSYRARLIINFLQSVTVGSNFRCGEGFYISCTDGGEIRIGSNVSLGRNVKFVAQSGSIVIGDNAFIGDGTIVVAKKSVKIGNDALIAEYVVIGDQDHGLDSDPIRSAGFSVASIAIDDNVWLGSKVSVLKGNHIGSDAVIAANAVVTKDVPSRHIFGGVPAESIGIRD